MKDHMDLLSNLSDELLITILSLLPTRMAARTSVLSRRFRHLWEACSSMDLNSQDVFHAPRTENFVAMADRALLRRDASLSLVSLHLVLPWNYRLEGAAAASFVSSLLSKARSLSLRHLIIQEFNYSCFMPILPIIFSISTLKSLSLGYLPDPPPPEEFNFPSGTTLTCLTSLSLKLYGTDPVKLNQLLSELNSLEELHLNACVMHALKLSSNTIRKLNLIIYGSYPKLRPVELFLPSLETLHLELHGPASCISGEVPLLAKAVIVLRKIYAEDANTVANLLKFISNVEELSLCLKESAVVKYPIHILFDPKKGMPIFPNLKHLDVTACFHTHNFEAVTTMLHHSPALESLNLVHEVPDFTSGARGRKRKDWRSKLPRNADGNYRYAHFTNLNLGENIKEFMKWMSKKCTRKRQKMQQELV